MTPAAESSPDSVSTVTAAAVTITLPENETLPPSVWMEAPRWTGVPNETSPFAARSEATV